MNNASDQKCAIGLDPIEMGKTFGLIEEIHGDVKEIKATVIRQNTRISKLENWRWLLIGGAAVVTGITVAVVKYML
jgi:hypothetical protein